MAKRIDCKALKHVSGMLGLTFLMLCAGAVNATPDVQVNGLLPNQAIVTIDGKQRILKLGKPSPEGVTLLSADSQKALLSWQDQQFERTLSKQISSQYSVSDQKEEARIQRGENGHFFTVGQVNGQAVNFMMDTGAFAIAMSSNQADKLRLDWRSGKRFTSSTASGPAPSYEITLKSVTVGGITLYNVKAGVVIGSDMTDLLLGMSFLEKTEMREENNTMILRKKY